MFNGPGPRAQGELVERLRLSSFVSFNSCFLGFFLLAVSPPRFFWCYGYLSSKSLFIQLNKKNEDFEVLMDV